jgi:hypothetical protein
MGTEGVRFSPHVAGDPSTIYSSPYSTNNGFLGPLDHWSYNNFHGEKGRGPSSSDIPLWNNNVSYFPTSMEYNSSSGFPLSSCPTSSDRRERSERNRRRHKRGYNHHRPSSAFSSSSSSSSSSYSRQRPSSSIKKTNHHSHRKREGSKHKSHHSHSRKKSSERGHRSRKQKEGKQREKDKKKANNRLPEGHISKKGEKRLRNVYQARFVPRPTFLPEFSPFYFPLDANIEITATRGSGKTTLFKEIMKARAPEFKIVMTFSSTEDVQGAMEDHVPPAFNRSKMDLNMIDQYMKLREQQIKILKHTLKTLERLGHANSRRYKENEERLKRRQKEYVCFFFDDFADDPKNLNNQTFKRLRKMGRHYNVCLITNKQADVDTHRSERLAADTSIIFNTDDDNELRRAWESQFKDTRLFPTFDDFMEAQTHYCSVKGGCLVHVRRFDPRVPQYIQENYRTFAYQTRDLPKEEIGSFANMRIQLYNDAVYVPQKLLDEHTKQLERTRWYQEQLSSTGGDLGIPKAIQPPPPPPQQNGSTGHGKGKSAGKHKNASSTWDDEEEPDPVDPVPTRDGHIRIQTDPTGERFWNKPVRGKNRRGNRR